MIVDLVRNDLSKIAARGSVKVLECCRPYQFPQVYQLISTISCIPKPEVNFNDIIEATFPMAKMLVDQFQEEVPADIEELQKLPGVGRKTANVIASVVFNKPALAVDTHG